MKEWGTPSTTTRSHLCVVCYTLYCNPRDEAMSFMQFGVGGGDMNLEKRAGARPTERES